MPEIQTVILNVEEGKRKDGSTIVSKTGSKLHKIKVDAYSEAIACWDPSMSQVASSFIGKQVVLDVGSKPSGDFQNYTLYAIRLDGDGTVTLEPNKVSETPQASRGTHNTGGMDEATVQRITRLSCLSSAATLGAGTLNASEVLDLAEVFVNYAFNGRDHG